MSVVDVLRTFVLTGIVASGTLSPPSELLIEDIAGFEVTSEPATDIDFAELSRIEPQSVTHIDPESEEALGLVAAKQTWTQAGTDESIVVEVVRAIDDDAATAFVDQAAATSIAVGLGAVDPPFGGAWSYSGALQTGWRNVVAWTQGPYAVVMVQQSGAAGDRTVLDDAAVRQVELILTATGAEVSEDATVDEDAPTPPTEVPPDDADGSTFPVGSLLVVLLVAGVGVGVMLQQRRRAGAAG